MVETLKSWSSCGRNLGSDNGWKHYDRMILRYRAGMMEVGVINYLIEDIAWSIPFVTRMENASKALGFMPT
jgi:hypothetical protein